MQAGRLANCSHSMAALRERRRREVPAGTVGGRTALTQYPSRQTCSAEATAHSPLDSVSALRR